MDQPQTVTELYYPLVRGGEDVLEATHQGLEADEAASGKSFTDVSLQSHLVP